MKWWCGLYEHDWQNCTDYSAISKATSGAVGPSHRRSLLPFCVWRPFGWPRIVWPSQISASLQGQLLWARSNNSCLTPVQPWTLTLPPHGGRKRGVQFSSYTSMSTHKAGQKKKKILWCPSFGSLIWFVLPELGYDPLRPRVCCSHNLF